TGGRAPPPGRPDSAGGGAPPGQRKTPPGGGGGAPRRHVSPNRQKDPSRSREHLRRRGNDRQTGETGDSRNRQQHARRVRRIHSQRDRTLVQGPQGQRQYQAGLTSLTAREGRSARAIHPLRACFSIIVFRASPPVAGAAEPRRRRTEARRDN